MTIARSASFALAAFASIGVVSAATSPAFAAEDVRTRAVEYGDLDLGSRRGVERLNSRIDMAVKRVCNVDNTRDLRAVAEAKKCEAASRSRAEGAANAAVQRHTRLAGTAQSPAG